MLEKKFIEIMNRIFTELTRENLNPKEKEKKNFFDKSSGYEDILVDYLMISKSDDEFIFESEKSSRYWDIVFYNKSSPNEKMRVEIKKGKSIWLDMVRYSEIYLKKAELSFQQKKKLQNDDKKNQLNLDCKEKTYTLFIIPDKGKNKVNKMYLLRTEDLVKNIIFDIEDQNNRETWAEKFIDIYKNFSRINAQKPLSCTDSRLEKYDLLKL